MSYGIAYVVQNGPEFTLDIELDRDVLECVRGVTAGLFCLANTQLEQRQFH